MFSILFSFVFGRVIKCNKYCVIINKTRNYKLNCFGCFIIVYGMVRYNDLRDYHFISNSLLLLHSIIELGGRFCGTIILLICFVFIFFCHVQTHSTKTLDKGSTGPYHSMYDRIESLNLLLLYNKTKHFFINV